MMSEQAAEAFERALGTVDGAWHEYNLQVAAEFLAEFSAQDWERLQTVVLSKPAYWQERCAEAVGDLESEEGVRVLITLLDSAYIPVAVIAASELDNLSVQLPLSYENTLRKLLDYLNEDRSPRNADVQRLINNLR